MIDYTIWIPIAYLLGALPIGLIVGKLTKRVDVRQYGSAQKVRERFKFIPYAPICFTSALRKTGIQELLDTSESVFKEWSKGVPRYDLRRTVMNAVAEHPPSTTRQGGLKIYSVAQDNTGPPSFTFYVNRSDLVHFSYQRYLENALRRAYDFKGSPLRMQFKGRRERERRER